MYILRTLRDLGLITPVKKAAYGIIYAVPIENIPKILNKLIEMKESVE